jgi:methylaspartate ammonia-lyase
MAARGLPRIARVIAAPAVGGAYTEDVAALRANAIPLADRYRDKPVAPGFRAVQEAPEVVSVGIVLADPTTGAPDLQRVVWGDCVPAACGGPAGRDPGFRPREVMDAIRQIVAPLLEGRPLTGFRAMAEEVDRWVVEAIPPDEDNDRRRDRLALPIHILHRALVAPEDSSEQRPGLPERRCLQAAVCCGVSQALLGAVALARGQTMAEVIAEEYGLPLPDAPAPVHVQAGSDWHDSVDRLIARRVDSLPHILAGDIPGRPGAGGRRLVELVQRLHDRIGELGGGDYFPAIHIDVQGALGKLHNNNLGKVLGSLYALEQAAGPCALRVESPVIMETRAAQIDAMKKLGDYIRVRHMKVRLVVDEWAGTLEDIRAFVEARAAAVLRIRMPDLGSLHNTVEAALACREAGIGTFLSGSCAETDLSARAAVHVALAIRPDAFMARPGMDIDEAVTLARSEMSRILALLDAAQTGRN